MFKIQSRTSDQISMDRCTGKYILHLRAASIAMEKSYSRLNLYRGGVLSVCIFTAGAGCAPAIQTFNSIATIERQIQKGVRAYWNEQKVTWKTTLPAQCHLPLGTGRNTFPEFPFSVLTEGTFALGDIQNLRLRELEGKQFQLTLSLLSLTSTAELKKDLRNEWTVGWTQ